MFISDFYPTPKEIIAQMTWDLDLKDKVVLEPSAGKGDIVDFCAGSGAHLLACEINDDLRSILNTKPYCKVIANDFLTVSSDMISHVDYIIMNPPFSADEKHISHAYEIAPEGCTIVALCNWQTLENDYTASRKKLKSLINNYGNCQNIGDAFSTAERKTGIYIGLIRLYKPKTSSDNDFSEYFSMDEDPEEDQFDGLVQHSFIREAVNRYVYAIKQYDSLIDASVALNNSISHVAHRGFKDLTVSVSTENALITKETFAKELQKRSWNYIFNALKMDKYVTIKVKEDINKMIEQQSKIPFTMKNINLAVSALIQNVSKYMDISLEEVFNSITSHYHENRWSNEGWKTNSHYLVNEKFILPNICGISWGGNLEIPYGWKRDLINDLNKALCFVTRTNYDDIEELSQKVTQDNRLKFKNSDNYLTKQEALYLRGYKYTECYGSRPETFRTKTEALEFAQEHPEQNLVLVDNVQFGKWFDWGFFEVKLFKKGTGHFKFKDRDVWALFNQQIARIKGFPLPEAVETKSKKF